MFSQRDAPRPKTGGRPFRFYFPQPRLFRSQNLPQNGQALHNFFFGNGQRRQQAQGILAGSQHQKSRVDALAAPVPYG